MEEYDFEYECMYMGGGGHAKECLRYPHFMYCDGDNPLLVADTREEEEARVKGYDNITASAMSNRNMVNWYWDLEDMSPRQLLVFAQDEYGVDLPGDASQEKLFSAVCKLSKAAPQNRNRLVLMAHTIKMSYEATQEEIKRMAAGNGQNLETTTETFEIWA